MAKSSPHLWDVGKCHFPSGKEGREVLWPGKLWLQDPTLTSIVPVGHLQQEQYMSSYPPHVQRDRDRAQNCATSFLSSELFFSLQRRNYSTLNFINRWNWLPLIWWFSYKHWSKAQKSILSEVQDGSCLAKHLKMYDGFSLEVKEIFHATEMDLRGKT